MHKTAIALLAAAALCPPAFSQTQVSMYGVVDMGLNRVSNVDGRSLTELRSGNSLTSRWGLRGHEDLGGGTRAAFNMEAGLNADTGAFSSAATFWSRQSWLGLSNKDLGELRAGLQLSLLNDAFALSNNSTYLGTQTAALDGSSSAGSSAARFDNMVGGTRTGNTVKFRSASMGGFKAGAMVGFGEQEGAAQAKRLESASLSYTHQAWEASAVYQLRRCDGGATCANDQIWGLGASYLFSGKGRISAFATQQKNAKHVAGNDAHVFSVLGVLPIQPWTLIAGYQALDDRSAAHQDVQQANIGVKYNLGKRTDVYSIFSLQKVDNGGKAGMFAKTSSNGRQHQWNVGMRHSF